jgi:hypothetical protein
MATTCSAIQTPKLGNIVKVVKSEDGLEGLTGEVRDISENGLIGVEFLGWGAGAGHRLDDHLDEPDGWYLAQEDLEVL